MNFDDIGSLVLLGCGKMGSALLQGWLSRGLAPDNVWVVDPHPSDWLKAQGVHLNTRLPETPDVVLVAVKPQMIADTVPGLDRFGTGKTLFVSIAAGTTLATFGEILGKDAPVVRTMPNTPAAIGRGITALVGNGNVDAPRLALAEALLSVVGQTVTLQDEAQIDAVTGVSGSGPAYVFHLIETLAAGGEAQGLSPELAMTLAKATVAGAGALAEASDDSPSQLRSNVTSPNGTTAAALEVLMDESAGFPSLLPRAVKAATDRSKELGK
ncbi:MAG: pyrroline-5-carboxylate reductase [Pseudomonadota bacterium]